MRKVYFDYAASTPVDPLVLEVMNQYQTVRFANPGSVHGFGREAQAALDMSRQGLANAFGVDFGNIVFTASATEANNLALQGVIKQYWSSARASSGIVPHIITTLIEHESVLAVCKDLEKQGLARVTYVPVSRTGFVNVPAVVDALCPETVLVSVMYVNNVTGAIQPVKEVAGLVKSFKKDKLSPSHQSRYTPRELLYPIFHTDAAQAVHSLESIGLLELGVDAMTISSHKVCGPKGAGALITGLPPGESMAPLMIGGMQEFGMRAGTPDVPDVVGFAKALELTRSQLAPEVRQTRELKERLLQGIIKAFPKAVVNSYAPCVESVCNVSFPGFGLEELLYKFDQKGIAVASGSACSAKALKSSHVLLAMGLPESIASSAVRFSFGRFSSPEDVKYCLEQLPLILS